MARRAGADPRTVPCPTCRAAAGATCATRGGTPTGSHVSRVEAAAASGRAALGRLLSDPTNTGAWWDAAEGGRR